jgi:hypothetical protein
VKAEEVGTSENGPGVPRVLEIVQQQQAGLFEYVIRKFRIGEPTAGKNDPLMLTASAGFEQIMLGAGVDRNIGMLGQVPDLPEAVHRGFFIQQQLAEGSSLGFQRFGHGMETIQMIIRFSGLERGAV